MVTDAGKRLYTVV